MDWMELLEQFFTVCLFPALGLLMVYVIKWLDAKRMEIKDKTENELHKKYIDLLGDTITNCVIATNQTYVNSLKEQGAFDGAAQKEAFKKTYNAVLNILSTDAKVYLAQAFGDLEKYITIKIEDEVNTNKKEQKKEDTQC